MPGAEKYQTSGNCVCVCFLVQQVVYEVYKPKQVRLCEVKKQRTIRYIRGKNKCMIQMHNKQNLICGTVKMITVCAFENTENMCVVWYHNKRGEQEIRV